MPTCFKLLGVDYLNFKVAAQQLKLASSSNKPESPVMGYVKENGVPLWFKGSFDFSQPIFNDGDKVPRMDRLPSLPADVST